MFRAAERPYIASVSEPRALGQASEPRCFRASCVLPSERTEIRPPLARVTADRLISRAHVRAKGQVNPRCVQQLQHEHHPGLPVVQEPRFA